MIQPQIIRWLRAPGVHERRGRSKSQTHREIRDGLMTPPIHPASSPGISVWPEYEIDELNAAEMRGATEHELRQLVRDLIARRAQGREAAA